MADLTAKIVPDNTVVTVPRAQATEVEPNTYLVAQPPGMPPMTGRHAWRRREDGAYEPVLELRSALIPLSEWNPKRYGCSKQTIYRLVIGGFVRGDMPGPGTLVIDLDSFYRHLDAVRNEPLFWNEERLAQYAAARLLHNKGLGGLGHRRRKVDRDLVVEAVKRILASPGTLNQLPSVQPPPAEPRPAKPRQVFDHPELFPIPTPSK
jgi:hypothetical protein